MKIMLNNVTIMGRLTRDIEVKEANGHKVVNNTLAVARDGKDEGTYFIDVVIWDGRAEGLAKSCTKGSMIVVNGRLRQDTYTDKEGKSRSNVRVNANNWYFGEAKKAAGDAPDAAPADPVADAGGVQFPW
jgi:single-strand DNA-binding protein